MMNQRERRDRLLAIALTDVPNANFEFSRSLTAKALTYAAMHPRLSPAKRIQLMEEARRVEQFLRKVEDRVRQGRRRRLIDLTITVYQRVKKLDLKL